MFVDAADYPMLVQRLTRRAGQGHFSGLVRGDVVRYELPRVRRLNVLFQALDGRVSATTRSTRTASLFGPSPSRWRSVRSWSIEPLSDPGTPRRHDLKAPDLGGLLVWAASTPSAPALTWVPFGGHR